MAEILKHINNSSQLILLKIISIQFLIRGWRIEMKIRKKQNHLYVHFPTIKCSLRFYYSLYGSCCSVVCCAGFAGFSEADWAAYFAIRVLWILGLERLTTVLEEVDLWIAKQTYKG